MKPWKPQTTRSRTLRQHLRRFRVVKQPVPEMVNRGLRPSGVGATLEWGYFHLSINRLQSMYLLHLKQLDLEDYFYESFLTLAKSHPTTKGDQYVMNQIRRGQRELHRLRRFKIAPSTQYIDEDMRTVWSEMFLCKIIDAFEFYLTAVLRKSLKRNPGAMSGASIKVKEIIESKDIDDALGRVIEKQVYEASFSGLTGVTDYLKDRFSVDIDRKTEHYRRLNEAIEVRHLVVHNGSLVSTRFINNTRVDSIKVGERFNVTVTYVLDTLKAVYDVSNEIDGVLLLRKVV